MDRTWMTGKSQEIIHFSKMPYISEAIDFYAGMDTISDIELSVSDEGDRM